MSIYMQVDGIKGSVSLSGHQGWIELSSVDFALARHIHTQPGHATSREGSLPMLSELEITKPLDAASNGLFQAACKGQALAKVTIHLCNTDTQLSPYAKYELSNVIIARTQTSARGNAHPAELYRLNYTQLQITHIDRDKTNTAQSPNTVGYNQETAEAL